MVDCKLGEYIQSQSGPAWSRLLNHFVHNASMEDDHGVIGQRTFRESEINSTHSRHGQFSSSRGE